MSLFAGIIGHPDQCDYLERVAKEGKLSHAYLFTGPAQLGKETIARKLVADASQVQVVERLLDEKTGERKSTIPVESIRELRQYLSLSSFDGGKKVAIITDADTMTTAAQNALLKTLEEPKGDTLLILIATRTESVLETIQSRTVQLYFSPVPRETICQALTQEVGKDEAHRLAGFAAGRPGLALSLIHQDQREEFEERMQEARAFIEDSFAGRIQRIDALVKEKDKDRMRLSIQAMRQVLHDCLLISNGSVAYAAQPDQLADVAQTRTGREWAQALATLTTSEQSILKHINANLALEQVAIQLGV